jgi:hypothetical protein
VKRPKRTKIFYVVSPKLSPKRDFFGPVTCGSRIGHFLSERGIRGSRKGHVFLERGVCGSREGHVFLERGVCGSREGHVFLERGVCGSRKGHVFLERGVCGSRKGHVFLERGVCGSRKRRGFVAMTLTWGTPSLNDQRRSGPYPKGLAAVGLLVGAPTGAA